MGDNSQMVRVPCYFSPIKIHPTKLKYMLKQSKFQLESRFLKKENEHQEKPKILNECCDKYVILKW